MKIEERYESDQASLSLAGQLSSGDEKRLRETVLFILSAGYASVLVELDVEVMNSEGVAEPRHVGVGVHLENNKLAFMSMTPRVKELLSNPGLLTVFHFKDDEPSPEGMLALRTEPDRDDAPGNGWRTRARQLEHPLGIRDDRKMLSKLTSPQPRHDRMNFRDEGGSQLPPGVPVWSHGPKAIRRARYLVTRVSGI